MPNPADDAYSFYPAMARSMAGFGVPSSQQYMASMPMQPRDYMHSSNRFLGNSAYSPLGIMNSGSPLLDIGGNMALQGMLGDNFMRTRPLSSVGVPDLDFFRGRVRMSEMQNNLESQIQNLNSPYLVPRIGAAAAGNMFIQRGFDSVFNLGGSQMGAFQTLHGGMGHRMGGTLAEQASSSFSALKQMNEFFTKTSEGEFGVPRNSGELDFRRTYGLDRVQLAESIDAGARYGIGGLSQEKFAKAVKSGTAGQMMKDNARVFSAGQQVFGRDKSMEELAQLMTQSVDGFQGLDANKATDLLHKVQATSRAVGISTKAFAEYSQMMSQMYNAVGAGGSSSSDFIMRGAMNARTATDAGRRTGDAGLSDANKNLEAAGRNMLDAANSPALRRAQGLASIAANLSPEQRASIRIRGVGTLADLTMPGGKMQKILDSGDSAALINMLDAVDSGMESNPYLNRGALTRRGKNLSSQDREDAAKLMDFTNASSFNGLAARNDLVKSMATDGSIDADILASMGPGGLSSLMGKMDSLKQGSSYDSVREELETGKAGMNLNKEQRDRLAAQFSYQVREQTNNVNYLKGWGFQSRDDFNVEFAKTSDNGIRATTEGRDEVSGDVVRQKFIQHLSGDVMRPLNIAPEAISAILNIAGDIESGAISMRSITGEDGTTIDKNKLSQLGMKQLNSVLKVNETRALMSVIESGAFGEAKVQGDAAYQKELGVSRDRGKAEAARDRAIQQKAEEVFEKISKEASPNAATSPATADAAASGKKGGGSDTVASSVKLLEQTVATQVQQLDVLKEIRDRLPGLDPNPTNIPNLSAKQRPV